mgnify:CR=1 FL=1
MKNYMEMKFSAQLRNVAFARGVVASFLLEQDLTISLINEIKTIVSEAVTNAIVHGYFEDPTKYVFLSMELEDNILKMIIEDKGVGIEDVEKARMPLYTTKENADRAGLGFTIMEIFADELDVISKLGEGTKVICIKKLI